MMLDYHIGAASIARSLSSYVITVFELIPFLKDNIPSWVGHGSAEMFGALSFNILAPILLVLLTVILCRGVGESSILNSLMTVTKRDLPLGITGSLLICIVLYNGVSLVITGMVPYTSLGVDAPLTEAFTSKGLKYVSVIISVGDIAGLTTTLLVGLYVQSRLYLGLGRDGLLPSISAKVHPTRHTPIYSQVWVGIIAIVLAGLFNVQVLFPHPLSWLTGYSVVAACVITLRWTDKTASQVSVRWCSNRMEGVLCLIIISFRGFTAGLYRFSASFASLIMVVFIAVLAIAGLYFRQVKVYTDPPGFSCPWVPVVSAVCILFNMFLFAQLHYEAWETFVILSTISVGIYAAYGQYHASPVSSNETIIYHRAPAEDTHCLH